MYMLCCESGAVDRTSGKVSHFHVIEKLNINIIEATTKKGGPVSLEPFKFQIVAAWRHDEGDKPDSEYEVEFALQRPEDEEETILQNVKFRFETEWLQRVVVNAIIGTKLHAIDGLFRIEARIRKAGTKTWLRQEYLIPINVIRTKPEKAPSPNGKKRKRK